MNMFMCIYVNVYLVQIRLLIKYSDKMYILISIFDINKQEIWELKRSFTFILPNMPSNLVNLL